MDEELLNPYLHSVNEVLNMMADAQVFSHSVAIIEKEELMSYGVCAVITFSGGIFSGRMILDLPPEVALKIANQLLGENYQSTRERMVLAAVCELSNTIAGNANTVINNQAGIGLRLAPPYAVTGEMLVLTTTKAKSVGVMFKTSIGFFRMYLTIKGLE